MTLLPSISKHLEKFTIVTDQIIHTLSLYASVCNNTVVMWALFIELIVSFCVKITQGKYMSHFAYACKMRYLLNLVLEKSEYLWFY